MKKKLFIPLAAIILSIGSTFALGIYEQINVHYNDIKIQVEQEAIDLAKKEFIFEGHVYVPLRFFAEFLAYSVTWNNQTKTVTLTKEKLVPCNPLEGEHFVYGQITSLYYNDRHITIEQHLDNNSREIYNKLTVMENVLVFLQRNNKEFKIDFSDVKVGDLVGLILNQHNEIRGIIVFT